MKDSILSSKALKKLELSLSFNTLSAGFPSPAEDFVEKSLDLNEHLIAHPAATFFIKVSGDSMIDAHIQQNDLLIVDRSLTPKNQSIVVAIVDGEFTLKRLIKDRNKIFLKAENKSYPSIEILPSIDFSIFGVVTYVIHQAT